MTTEYRQAALEALAHYNISSTEIELLRHNEKDNWGIFVNSNVGLKHLLKLK